MKERILMIPGPVKITPEVQNEVLKQPVPHRSKEFSDILSEVYQNLKYVFQTQNDVFIYTSSGTGAMCAALENLINPQDKVLCLINGKFSERWAYIAKSRDAIVETIEVDAGKSISPHNLEKYLERHRNIKIVTMAHCETSTGALNNIKDLCKIISHYGALSVVDGISSVGTEECKQDEWGIDVLISASQKGISAHAGLSFLSAGDRAFEAYKNCKNRSFYFDWNIYKAAAQNNSTPYTPAINTIMGLNASLKNIKNKGLEQVIQYRANLRSKLKEELENAGFEILAASNSCTAVFAPKNINASDIIEKMQNEFNIIVAGGQEELKDKIFRIGTIGDISIKDIEKTVEALRQICPKI